MRRQKYFSATWLILTSCYLYTAMLFSCRQDNQNKKVDVGSIKLNTNSVRFDKALFAIDTNSIEQGVNALGNKYPDFAQIYFQELTGFAKNASDDVFYKTVKHFLTYKDYRNLYDTVQKKFPDTKKLDQEIQDVLKHIIYYFPNKKFGSIYYFISGLNMWSAVTVDSNIGVGLDMHLGKQYPFYESVQIPYYQIVRCEPSYIPVNVSKAIYEDMYPFTPDGKTLLDMMIQRGKQLLFVEYTIPNASEEIICGYTPEQLAWCKENEGMIWNYLAKQKLLYSTQWQDILRYVNDGPTSTGMPAESPGNIGSWIGWQIVRAFMKQHGETTMPDILQNKMDAQTFVRNADYKPR